MPEEAPLDPVLRLIGRTPSALVGVALDDLAGAVEAPNIPGVVGASNWRRRTPMSVEKLTEPGGPLDRLAAAMGAEGRGRPRSTNPETPRKEIPAIVRPSPPET
jgi:(1->4)-alpha-D-glucan 1-alpha-D-glucosylmutase